MIILCRREGIGYVRADDEDLDRKLREGDGLAWAGDPSLELRYGILSAPRRMQHPVSHRWINRGDMVAKRYEVWRHTENGEDVIIGHWTLEEYDRILFDITMMRAGAIGKAPDVEQRIDAHNAEIEKKASADFRDHYGPMLDHLY